MTDKPMTLATTGGVDAEEDVKRVERAVECQFQDREGNWCWFHSDKHRDDPIASLSWPIRYLYAAPQTALALTLDE